MVCRVSPSARYGLRGIPQLKVWFAWYPQREIWSARYTAVGDVVGTVSPSSQQDLYDFARVNHNQEEVILFNLVTQILKGDNYMPLNV
jgi:hypothetical protein